MSHGYALEQVNLVVTDLERTREFYARLGWTFRAMGEQALTGRVPGEMLVSLHLPEFARTWNQGYDGGVGGAAVLDVAIPDRATVDRLHAELTASGHASHQQPWDAYWGSRYAIVADPDGNLIGLKSPY